MNNKTKRIISILLLTVMIISLCTVVNAEQPTDEFGFSGVIPDDIAMKNSEVFNEFCGLLNSEENYSIDLKYDENGRIVKFITKTNTMQENFDISYTIDMSFSINRTTIQNVDIELQTNDDVALFGSVGNYDDKMADAGVKNRISEAQEVWNARTDLRNLAHIEAEIARADYCVVYPKSTFASMYLENGPLSNGTFFRRTLKYVSPQMYGSDIMALQRALMASGNLDSTDVKPEEYGYFGPSTQAAVKEYQSEKGLTADGIAGNNTIKKLFNAGSINNLGLTSFENLNKINVFRTKHNLVCNALKAKLSASGANVITEAYVIGAGLKGNGGRADVVKVKSPTSEVWEVKPDSAYGRATGAPQVATYVNKSQTQENKSRYNYCPMTYGGIITPFSIPWNGGRTVYVSSYRSDGITNGGVVYYRDQKNNAPVWQPSTVPVVVPKQNEEYSKIAWPEPKTVCEGLITAGVLVTSIYIGKAILAGAFAGPTGGASLFLLCF